MQHHSNLTQSRQRPKQFPRLNKSIPRFILILFIFAIATPALADYLGPDRTTTESHVETYDYGVWAKLDPTNTSCTHTYGTACIVCTWERNPGSPCGDAEYSYKLGTKSEVVTTTTTLPPATISGSLQNCTLQNGWCITVPRLSLSANEPLSGYSILAIEGTRNGQSFACSGASCIVPLNEGNNNFAYWAISSWGDSSTMGTLSVKVDSLPPNITGSFTGTLGSNNWYITPLSFTGSASDNTSGLASFSCTLDGAALGSCNSINVSTNGPHTIVLTARDNAGQTTTLSQNASLDTQNPSLSAALSGTLGSNNWYTTAALTASASDPAPGSGLAALEYDLDATGWAIFPTSGVLNPPDGKHSVDIRAVDFAGRTISSSKSFWLDTTAPNVTLEPAGTSGLNGWYTSDLDLTASASDATSGVDVFEYSLNSGVWTAYTAPLLLSDGTHSLSFWAQDSAGLVTQVDRTYKVDTRPPQIGGSLSGVPGANGWYISDVTLSASVADPTPGSGIDAFTYILNGGAETPYAGALIFSDGLHTVQLSTRDNAGLTYSTEQTIKVDTIPPSLNIQTTLPNWIRDSVTLNGSAGDPSTPSAGQAGSGLSKVEISTDSGQTWQLANGVTSWSYTWNTQASQNGIRDVYVRATDNAGLTTKRSFSTGVDNRGPKISLPDSWYQWDTVTLHIWDDDSGLSEARVEISDPDGRWPTRIIRLDPGRFPLEFKWDRRFADGTIAPLGTYNLKVIAFDNLDNPAHKSASIKILLGVLPAGSTATPQPTSPSTPTPTPGQIAAPPAAPTQTAVVSVFGAVEPTAEVTPVVAAVSAPRTAPTQTNVLDWLQSVFSPNPDAVESTTEVAAVVPFSTTHSTDSKSSVLWGAAAAGVIGTATAYALEEKRKRREAEAQQAVAAAKKATQLNAAEEARKVQSWLEGQAILNAQLEEAKKQGASAEQVSTIKQMSATQGLGAAIGKAANLTQSLYKAIVRRATSLNQQRKEALVEEEMKSYGAKPQEWETAYNQYMAQKVVEAQSKKLKSEDTIAIAPPKEKSWWEKAIDWVDDHQVELAMGVGIVVGVGAVILTAGLALPALTVMAGAAVGAGGVVALGTMGLNAHYGRPWNEGLARNILVAEITAVVVSGGILLFQTATTMAGSYCAVHTTTCARAEPILNGIDIAEEAWLNAKLTYQTWRGDPRAADTALELQMEYLDGGMPGNSVAKDLGGQTLEAVAKYGDEALDLVKLYGDDAAWIISKYGDEGIAILQKYGDNALKLFNDHGAPAIKLLMTIDPTDAEKLLKILDDDVLDYAIAQGDDAIAALARWSADDLSEHGIELALRAKKDAKVLADVKKLIALGPIDPKHLTEEQEVLIKAIAANSTQYAGEGQVVLGKWVDFGSGFVEVAQDTSSVHYNPHPDMWNLLGEFGEEAQGEVAWLINKQVIQTGIDKGLPFEYTLNGIKPEDIELDVDAIEKIWEGARDIDAMYANIKEALDSEYVPFRMKELIELYNAGYTYSFDAATNSYILIKP